MSANQRLLREYIRKIIVENDGSFAIDTGGLGMGPNGSWGASPDTLFNVFVQPFADVVKTVKSEALITTAKIRTVLNVALVASLTTLLPIFKSNYSEIFKKEEQDISKIKSKYKDVYERTNKALGGDAAVAAFFYSPAAYLTFEFARKTPKAAFKLLNTLAGRDTNEGFSRKSGNLIENSNEKQLKREFEEKLEKLKKSPVWNELMSASKEMKQASAEAVGEAIKQIEGLLSGEVMTDEMTRKIMSKVEPKFKELSGEQQPQDKEKLLNDIKSKIPEAALKTLKQFLLTPLEKRVELMGNPEDLKKVINKLKNIRT